MERHIRNVPNAPRPRPSLAILLGLAGALLVGTPASAQDKTSEIDKIFGWATPDTPGCAVAVSQDGKLIVNRAYGLADLERGVPLTTDSVYTPVNFPANYVAIEDIQTIGFVGGGCLNNNEFQTFTQKFRITVGGTAFFPTTTINIKRGNESGVLKVDRTITTQ